MPQLDFDSLPPLRVACAGAGDRKIGCETLAGEQADSDIPTSSTLDLPPESFWLSKDAEFDWFDRNAFLERKESVKGNSNSMNPNSTVNPIHTSSSSLRFSSYLKSKAAIISFPKSQKTTCVDSKRRNCKLANILLFPKRLDSIGKTPTVVSMAEPSSPKVSCLGRVRSKNCRGRRKTTGPATEPEKPVAPLEKTDKVQKLGFISRIKSLFRSDSHSRRRNNSYKSSVRINQSSENSSPRRNTVAFNPANNEPVDPPGLGGVTRFSSGRRQETWVSTEMLT